MENNKLKDGDKYLSISILGNINLKAFRNPNRPTEKHPHYKGEGVAVWIKTYKETFFNANTLASEGLPEID